MNPHFKLTILTCIILLSAFSGALGIVWQKVEIAEQAKENLRTERHIRDLETELSDVVRLVAQTERRDNLIQLLAQHGSTLAPYSRQQTVHPGENSGPLYLDGDVSMASLENLSIPPAVQQPVVAPDLRVSVYLSR